MEDWIKYETAPGWHNGVLHNPPDTPFIERQLYKTGPHKSPNRLGWRSPLPYFREDRLWREMSGSVSTTFQGAPDTYTGNLYGVVYGMPPHVTDFDSSLRSSAEIGALLKLKDSKVNFAVAFGDRQQTINLVANTFNRIGGAFSDIRHGNLPRAFERIGIQSGRSMGRRVPPMSLKDAGALWLELQYGWKPLLSDIYGAASLLSDKDGGKTDRYLVTVKAKRDRFWEIKRPVPGWGWGTCLEEIAFEKGCFVRMDFRPFDENAATLSSVGVLNPMELAWELLPYSFVVDWALPIGDWLSAFDATVGYTFLAGSRSEFARLTASRTMGSGNGYVCSGSGYRRYSKFQRTPLSEPPSVMSAIPGWKNPLSLTHLANAMALMATSFGKVR